MKSLGHIVYKNVVILPSWARRSGFAPALKASASEIRNAGDLTPGRDIHRTGKNPNTDIGTA
jgi:hypothetical protein